MCGGIQSSMKRFEILPSFFSELALQTGNNVTNAYRRLNGRCFLYLICSLNSDFKLKRMNALKIRRSQTEVRVTKLGLESSAPFVCVNCTAPYAS